MLIRFEVANFRSVLDPIELSMVAVDRERPSARPFENIGVSLLTVAGVYGPNASGKSTVIAAFDWLKNAVEHSLRMWDRFIPVSRFAFDGGAERSTDFTVELIINGVRFEYVIELDATAVHYEALFHYPEKKRRRIFERDGLDLRLQRGLGALSGTRELLTERTLALSAAHRFDEPLVSEFVDRLISFRTFGLARHDRPAEPDTTAFRTSRRDRALALLRLADRGIDDVLIEDKAAKVTVVDGEKTESTIHFVSFTRANSMALLEFGEESQGTRTWFSMIEPVLSALDSGTALLFDELDASLHPTLSARLIELFHDPRTNPRGAQLIFTSHDTSLLNHLNRDEVWLTEKSAEGRTRLGALAEFAGERVRRSQNLEKAYLHGRFGALPDLDQADILRALGLIG